MKSLSRIYPQAAPEQLEAWALPELQKEFVVSLEEDQREHLLALFHQDQKTDGRSEKEFQPKLHSSASNKTVTPWLPGEIEPETFPTGPNAWDFSELSQDLSETIEKEAWPAERQQQAEKEAAAILRQARAQAEEIILEAQVTADQLMQQAENEIDLQKKEGYQQGWQQARNELGEALKATHAVVREVQAWRDSLILQGEPILVDMLKEISQTMFGEGVRLDANALQINLNRVMESAQKLGNLNIFLNVRDADLLDPSWSEYQLLITGNKVKIIPSEKIKPGGCIVKGTMGMVDGRVETQLAAVLNTIDEISGVEK